MALKANDEPSPPPLHKIESVDGKYLRRVRVDGGWIYYHDNNYNNTAALAFVPDVKK